MAAKKKNPAPSGMQYTPQERGTLRGLLKLIRKEGRVRVRMAFRSLAKQFKSNKVALRGFMKKLAEEHVLFELVDARDDVTYYYANKPGFYKPEQLAALIGDDEVQRIATVIEEYPWSAGRIARQVYGAQGGQAVHFVATILALFEKRGLITHDKNGHYSLTERGREFGVDKTSLLTLDELELENKVAQRREERSDVPTSLQQVARRLAADRALKTIPTAVAPAALAKQDSVHLLFMNEVLYGNQSTDDQLIDFVCRLTNPDLTFLSGLVQGTYTGIQHVDKRRVLVNSMRKIEPQFAAAGLLLTALEERTKHGVYYVQGDDDWELGRMYAELAQLFEGKIWQFGLPSSLGAYLRRRLNVEEFYRKWELQWERLLPYQYRIGRSLKNADEVFAITGGKVYKREYRLIMEILALKKAQFAIPPEYEKVVDVARLEGDVGKRHVTPDSLHLRLREDGESDIAVVHNTNFSTATQYVDPMHAAEMTVRQWQARGGKTPKMIIDCHQEKLFGHYCQGTWVMTTPGMQNTELGSTFRRKEFHRFVLQSKEHRQNTFRKDPTNPAAVEFILFDDGRLRMRITNDKVMQVLKRQRNQKHERHGVCVVTDVQHGSITMVPEAELLFMDYSLFDQGDDQLYFNGDIFHGINYPQHFSESRPLRLISINSQLNFTSAIHMPLIETAPNLEEVGWWLGNHEWNTFGRNITGTNDLEPLAKEVQARIRLLKEVGKEFSMLTQNIKKLLPQAKISAIKDLERRASERFGKLKVARSVARIRWMETHNDGLEGDLVNWPFFATNLCGFKLAISHMWQPYGGRTPMHQFQRWIRGMAAACGDIDVMVGGHLHSVYFAQEANKLMLQLGAAAGLSGYELVRGLFSTVMFTRLIFDNHEGIWVEYVPPKFLYDVYEPKSPFLKGKKAELMRPKIGTRDWKLGKQSPFIENVIDEVTQYLPV